MRKQQDQTGDEAAGEVSKGVSKFLSYVLRHRPEAIGITLDQEGWTDIGALIAAAHRAGQTLDQVLIHTVVETSDKKRFALSDDGQRIRAVQGHSADVVDIRYAERVPPEILFHGTATRFVESIRQQGLLPRSRHHVHLSQELQTATAVGQRHGKPAVLTVAAGPMHREGYIFHQADNGVWLTERVPARFITE